MFSCERSLEEGSVFYIDEGLCFIKCETKISCYIKSLGPDFTRVVLKIACSKY